MIASAPASAATSISFRRLEVAVVVGAGLGDHVGRMALADRALRRSGTRPEGTSGESPGPRRSPSLLLGRRAPGSRAATGSPRSSARPPGRARGRSRRCRGSRGASRPAGSGPGRGSLLAQPVVEPRRAGAVAVADDEQVVGVERSSAAPAEAARSDRHRRAPRGSARRPRCARRRSSSSLASCERPSALCTSLSR